MASFNSFCAVSEVFVLTASRVFLMALLKTPFSDFVSFGLLGGDAHVFLGGIFDRHMLSKIN